MREACHELLLSTVRIGPVAPTIPGGRAAAQEIVRSGLTAVQTYNDMVGIGVLRGLAFSLDGSRLVIDTGTTNHLYDT